MTESELSLLNRFTHVGGGGEWSLKHNPLVKIVKIFLIKKQLEGTLTHRLHPQGPPIQNLPKTLSTPTSDLQLTYNYDLLLNLKRKRNHLKRFKSCILNMKRRN